MLFRFHHDNDTAVLSSPMVLFNVGGNMDILIRSYHLFRMLFLFLLQNQDIMRVLSSLMVL